MLRLSGLARAGLGSAMLGMLWFWPVHGSSGFGFRCGLGFRRLNIEVMDDSGFCSPLALFRLLLLPCELVLASGADCEMGECGG